MSYGRRTDVMFTSRKEAGQKLAAKIVDLHLFEPVVLALPRGGVPVAAEIATALKAPFDILVVRKVGAPNNPELAVAAIVDGNPPDIVLNHEIIEAYGIDDADLRVLIEHESIELRRRRSVYLSDRIVTQTTDKTVVIVDDGAATGTTMLAAVRALRRRSPREIVVALPVASSEAYLALSREADRLLCLYQPHHFMALSYHYRNFPQLTDKEVLDLLGPS